MFKGIYLSSVALVGVTLMGFGGTAFAGSNSTSSKDVVVRVALEDASPGARVLGVETYYGLIVSAQKIKNVERPKNVKAEEIQNTGTLILKNGRVLEVRDVEFLYVRDQVVLANLQSESGKHPNTDEGASGTH